MDYKLLSLLFCSLLLGAFSKNLDVSENATDPLNSALEGLMRTGRSQSNLVYVSLISCAMSYDTECLVDAAGKMFEMKKNELLAQADMEAFRATGRSDPEHKPSEVAKTIEQLISEISTAFKNGFLGFFSSREGDDDNEVVDADEKDDDGSGGAREATAEVRKKKKKPLKSLIQVIKIAILAGIVLAKINLLLRVVETAIKFKFLLVAVGGLVIHGIKLWTDLKSSKKGGHDETNIVYRNPYEHGGDGNFGGPGEYHGRSYNGQKEYAQDLAYTR